MIILIKCIITCLAACLLKRLLLENPLLVLTSPVTPQWTKSSRKNKPKNISNSLQLRLTIDFIIIFFFNRIPNPYIIFLNPYHPFIVQLEWQKSLVCLLYIPPSRSPASGIGEGGVKNPWSKTNFPRRVTLTATNKHQCPVVRSVAHVTH